MQQLNGMQLTPEQMAQLSNQFAGNYGNVTRDGFDFAAAVNSGGYGAEGAGDGNSGQVMGFSAVPTGTGWDLEDGEDFYGGFDASGKFEGARQPHAFDMGDAAPFLFALAAGGAALAPGAMGGAMSGAGGTGAAGPGMAGWGADLGVSSAGGLGGGGAGLGGAVAGDAFLPGALGAGYEGATLTGLDAYLAGGASAAGGAAGGAAGTGGGSGAGAWTTAAADSQAANAALGLGPVSGATAPAIATNAGSAWGMKDLLGIGSTLAGAASGAQGQDAESSTTKDIPSWLKPYVQKNLGYASGLLDKQMAPGAMPGYEAMRNTGMGLLNTPQMGNGFNRFFPGK